MPALVAKAGVALAIAEDRLYLATLFALGFFCLLRTGELLQLRKADIAVGSHRAVINLRFTKSGQRTGNMEAIATSEPRLVQLLQLITCDSSRANDAPLWTGSAQSFRSSFSYLLDALGLNSFRFKPYGLRRGGATYLLQLQTPVEHILRKQKYKLLLPGYTAKTAWLRLQRSLFHPVCRAA